MAELIVSTRASADYTLADSTISDLGNTTCRLIRGQELCSDWHLAMNVTFVWFGCTLALGALLWGSRHLVGRAGTAAVVLWCVSGLGSVGVGLVPVSVNGALHTLVALPVFVAQPLALLMTGISLRSTRTMALAAISGIGVLAFAGVLASDGASYLGAAERLALWPGYIWVAVVVAASAGGGQADRLRPTVPRPH